MPNQKLSCSGGDVCDCFNTDGDVTLSVPLAAPKIVREDAELQTVRSEPSDSKQLDDNDVTKKVCI